MPTKWEMFKSLAINSVLKTNELLKNKINALTLDNEAKVEPDENKDIIKLDTSRLPRESLQMTNSFILSCRNYNNNHISVNQEFSKNEELNKCLNTNGVYNTIDNNNLERINLDLLILNNNNYKSDKKSIKLNKIYASDNIEPNSRDSSFDSSNKLYEKSNKDFENSLNKFQAINNLNTNLSNKSPIKILQTKCSDQIHKISNPEEKFNPDIFLKIVDEIKKTSDKRLEYDMKKERKKKSCCLFW